MLFTSLAVTHGNFLNHNRKLKISTAPTKAKSWEPAYSQALIQNKIQRVRQAYGYGGWCLELRQGGR